MGRWMPVVVLVFLLVGLACPVHAQEGEGEISVQDGIVEDEPPPVPDLEPSFSLDPPDDFDNAFQVGGEDDGVWIGIGPDITSSDSGVDGAAILELLGSINLLLGYIFVMLLLSSLVTAGKLIYSLFNMFF